MQTRSLNRRILLSGVAVIVLALVVILVMNRSRLNLFGTASGSNAQTVVNNAYTTLSTSLGKTISTDNSTYTWSLSTYADTSLGCPQPGTSYSQVPTDGYKIVITYDGTTYDFRVNGDGSGIILCSTTQTENNSGGNANVKPTDTSEPAALIDAALADASTRGGISLTRANSRFTYNYQQFPSAALGCPQPDRMYAQALTWGWQIVITPNDGGSYDYRGIDATKFWFCK